MTSILKTVAITIAFGSLTLGTACGGKTKDGTSPAAGGGSAAGPSEGDDPATPFDDGAVKASLAGSPGVESCGVDASTTMGAHFAAQRDSLIGGGDGGNAVDESFSCQAQGDGAWECTWSVFGKPSAPDPCDPCAEGGSSGYQIIFAVGNDGAIMPDKIYCNAPG
jgi:hypothetical protein